MSMGDLAIKHEERMCNTPSRLRNVLYYNEAAEELYKAMLPKMQVSYHSYQSYHSYHSYQSYHRYHRCHSYYIVIIIVTIDTIDTIVTI